MAYSKSDPRHPMNRELTGPSTVQKMRPASSYGMKDRKAKPKMNCTVGRFASK